MTQVYSDPSRETDPYSLPNIEVFYMDAEDAAESLAQDDPFAEQSETIANELAGWYWWPCFPGCLPDNNPIGPFATEQEAIDDAQDY